MEITDVRFGVRIEFYASLDAAGLPAGELDSAATKEDGFRGLTLPRAGDRVSTASLVGEPTYSALLHSAGMGVPFARVAHVEQYPVAVEVDETPSATIVMHARTINDADRSQQLAQLLAEHGWYVVTFADR